MVKQLLLALRYMHSNNIVHRDVKLENIMTNQSRTHWSLVDFGLATKTDKKISELAGTGLYMSPEVVKGSYGKESDLWSLGVVIYKILTGNFPFEGKNMSQIFCCIKRGVYNPLPSNVSNSCKDFVKGLLTVSSSNRLTAIKALQHEWIIKNTSEQQSSVLVKKPCITKNHLEKLQLFEMQSLLKS